jgi:hypothetical protein
MTCIPQGALQYSSRAYFSLYSRLSCTYGASVCALPLKEMVITGKSIRGRQDWSCRTHRELLRGLGHHASNALSVIKSSLNRFSYSGSRDVSLSQGAVKTPSPQLHNQGSEFRSALIRHLKLKRPRLLKNGGLLAGLARLKVAS